MPRLIERRKKITIESVSADQFHRALVDALFKFLKSEARRVQKAFYKSLFSFFKQLVSASWKAMIAITVTITLTHVFQLIFHDNDEFKKFVEYVGEFLPSQN